MSLTKLKSWALFLLVMGPSILLALLSESPALSKFDIASEMVGLAFYYFWLRQIAVLTGLGFGRGSIFFSAVFLMSFLCFEGSLLFMIISKHDTGNFLTLCNLIALIMLFLAVMQISRSLQIKITSRVPTWPQCIPNALLILMFPIGVWIIQPMIRQIE